MRMSVKQFAAQLKELIEDIKSKGTAAIYCEDLIAYLNKVQNSPEIEPTAVEIERFKAYFQNWVETNKRQHEQQLEMFRSVISSGQGAIKTSFLLNGGAAVALLAFISHLAQFDPVKVATFATCLLPFSLGVMAVAVTSGFTYLSQWFYSSLNPSARTAGFVLNILCILLGLSSYALFAWGLFSTYGQFLSYK
jgi:hypothetical protein